MLLFKSNKKEKEVQRAIVRLVNQHTDALHDDVRLESRVSLTAAVVVVPWEEKRYDATCALSAVTKEFSSTGASLVVSRLYSREDIVAVGMRREGAIIFFRGTVMHVDELGGGFWVLGLKFSEVIEIESHPELKSLSI